MRRATEAEEAIVPVSEKCGVPRLQKCRKADIDAAPEMSPRDHGRHRSNPTSRSTPEVFIDVQGDLPTRESSKPLFRISKGKGRGTLMVKTAPRRGTFKAQISAKP